jgi:hypothetical protein
LPASATKRAELVVAYGSDAVLLLRAVADPGAPAWRGRPTQTVSRPAEPG